MPQHFKVVIGRSYEGTRKKDWNGRYPSITVSIGEVSAGLPKWDDNSGESLDLEASLNRSADTFTSWRYIYEFKKPDAGGWQFHRLEYGISLLLRLSGNTRRPLSRCKKIRQQFPKTCVVEISKFMSLGRKCVLNCKYDKNSSDGVILPRVA